MLPKRFPVLLAIFLLPLLAALGLLTQLETLPVVAAR